MNIDALAGIVPEKILLQVPSIKQIDGPLRLCHFLSQLSHESQDFTVIQENLNYNAGGLLRVFGKHFSYRDATNYQHDPVGIGSRAYANRMGNGDESSGDGYKYRGRGYLQCTGADNYKSFGDYIGEDCLSNPNLVAFKYPLESAAWFFTVNNIWTVCDKGRSNAVVQAVTKVVNGGKNGLVDRQRLFSQYYDAVSA
jgi:putative chitinase